MARYLSEEPGLQAFVDQIDRFPVLDRDRELDLARRFRDTGDRSATDELIKGHLRSVVKMAHKYRGYGIYLSDLIAEGNLGLLEAAKRFDPERGLRFLTYARYWVRAFMLAHILKHWSIVDLGTTALQSKMFFKLQSENARLVHELGAEDESIPERLAETFRTDVENVRRSLSRLGRRDASLDVPLMPDSAATFGEMLTDENTVDQEQLAADAEEADMVHRAVAQVWPGLDCRQRLILRERLLPEGQQDPVTLASLGRRLGVTRERVRQVEAELKKRLRAAFESVSACSGRPGAPLNGDCGDCPSQLCAA